MNLSSMLSLSWGKLAWNMEDNGFKFNTFIFVFKGNLSKLHLNLLFYI